MKFIKVFYGGGGIVYVDSGLPHPGAIYAITSDGRLLWYEDEDRRGKNGPHAERGWAAGSSSQIGIGWDNFKHVFSDGDGIIYAITPDGRMLWYKDESRQGRNGPNAEKDWAAGTGNQIRDGLDDIKHIFSSGSGRGGGGVIYAITSDGRLLWYKDENRKGQNGPKGENGWATGSGNQIGIGWGDFIHVSGHGGIIYAITPDGRLLWYRDENMKGQNGPNGERYWAAGSGNQIGIGWEDFKCVFCGGSIDYGEIIYAITTDGRLLWYKDDFHNGQNGPDGERGWATGSGNQIGVGWNMKYNFSNIKIGNPVQHPTKF